MNRLRIALCLAAFSAASACAQDDTKPLPPQTTPPQAEPIPPPQDVKPIPPGSTVLSLPPTPMLDEEGRQRLDPDGKPMFNPPVTQQRDKKGHPLFDAAGKPVMQTPTELGYDEHGHRIHASKDKSPKTVKLAISRGTLTVDGMTGKAGLNYDIADLKYIYLYAPWVGMAVVSNAPFPGATEEPKAFAGNTLTVTVADHTFQVYSDKILLDKKPQAAYVLVDRSFSLPTKFPVMGYGPLRSAPYAWPGSRPNEPLKGALVQPPPLPENLRPAALLAPCPAGQMRLSPAPASPGQPTAAAQPCVPIPKAAPKPPHSETQPTN